jgi:hypothetical protein
MASVGETLFSAVLGVAGGILGAGIVERLKAGVASLDAELTRLETFEDDLFDVFDCPAGHVERATMLRRLAGCRRRLGLNIRRKVPDSIAYQACKGNLVKLDGYLTKAEDAEQMSDDLEGQIQATILSLRRHLQRSSRTARAFAFLRGNA